MSLVHEKPRIPRLQALSLAQVESILRGLVFSEDEIVEATDALQEIEVPWTLKDVCEGRGMPPMSLGFGWSGGKGRNLSSLPSSSS